MSLQITAQPVAEPVTTEQVKLALRLTTSGDDDLIASYIPVARAFAETVTGKSLASKGYTLNLEKFPWPHQPIILPRPPVSSVGTITYMDITGATQTWDPEEYIVGLSQVPAIVLPVPGTMYPATFCAPGLSTVTVPFTAGPGAGAYKMDLAGHIEGIRQLAAHFYEHPSAVNADNLKEMPLGIQTLLGANKIYSF